MAKPGTIYFFNTAHTNAVPTTAGHQVNGWGLHETPGSQEVGYILGSHSDWIDWLYKSIATITVTKFPEPFCISSGAWNVSDGWFGGEPALNSTATGNAWVDLDVPQGYKLSTLTLRCVGNAASNLALTVLKAATDNTAPAGLGTLTLNALSATAADQTMNMLAASTTNAGGQTVTVAAAGGTYTRSAGSYITDGFFVGQVIAWAGFVNGGNNTAGKVITALSATVMTVSNTGMVNETGGASATQATGVSPTVDSTFALQLKIAAGTPGANLAVKSLRYTIVPQ